MIPTIHTERLTLRPHVMADFDLYAGMLADPERSRFMGGPHDRRKAWSWFCGDVAEWHLMNHGSLAVTLKDSGDYVGQVAIIRPIHFPEEELGWSVFAAHEGHGYITEAATALRDWAFGPRGLTTLVSYIDPANTRSQNVAKRLGATLDPSAATPNNEPTGVWRLSRAA